MSTPNPSSDVSVTAPGCPACGQPLPVGRSRRFCSAACRQAAYRRRHQRVAREAPLPRRQSRLQGTLYQCPDCETRYGSDLKSHANDRLSDRAQAGVVVAGVPAHELVGVIDRNRFPLRRDPLGLFEDDP